eukprot:gene10238-8155_t
MFQNQGLMEGARAEGPPSEPEGALTRTIRDPPGPANESPAAADPGWCNPPQLRDSNCASYTPYSSPLSRKMNTPQSPMEVQPPPPTSTTPTNAVTRDPSSVQSWIGPNLIFHVFVPLWVATALQTTNFKLGLIIATAIAGVHVFLGVLEFIFSWRRVFPYILEVIMVVMFPILMAITLADDGIERTVYRDFNFIVYSVLAGIAIISMIITYPLGIQHVQEMVPWVYSSHDDVIACGYVTTGVLTLSFIASCLLYLIPVAKSEDDNDNNILNIIFRIVMPCVLTFLAALFTRFYPSFRLSHLQGSQVYRFYSKPGGVTYPNAAAMLARPRVIDSAMMGRPDDVLDGYMQNNPLAMGLQPGMMMDPNGLIVDANGVVQDPNMFPGSYVNNAPGQMVNGQGYGLMNEGFNQQGGGYGMCNNGLNKDGGLGYGLMGDAGDFNGRKRMGVNGVGDFNGQQGMGVNGAGYGLANEMDAASRGRNQGGGYGLMNETMSSSGRKRMGMVGGMGGGMNGGMNGSMNGNVYGLANEAMGYKGQRNRGGGNGLVNEAMGNNGLIPAVYPGGQIRTPMQATGMANDQVPGGNMGGAGQMPGGNRGQQGLAGQAPGMNGRQRMGNPVSQMPMGANQQMVGQAGRQLSQMPSQLQNQPHQVGQQYMGSNQPSQQYMGSNQLGQQNMGLNQQGQQYMGANQVQGDNRISGMQASNGINGQQAGGQLISQGGQVNAQGVPPRGQVGMPVQRQPGYNGTSAGGQYMGAAGAPQRGQPGQPGYSGTAAGGQYMGAAGVQGQPGYSSVSAPGQYMGAAGPPPSVQPVPQAGMPTQPGANAKFQKQAGSQQGR